MLHSFMLRISKKRHIRTYILIKLLVVLQNVELNLDACMLHIYLVNLLLHIYNCSCIVQIVKLVHSYIATYPHVM